MDYDKLNYVGSPPKVLQNFIVLEGLDGSGISTQSRLLEKYLAKQGRPCERSAEPTKGRVGRHIRFLLQSQKAAAELEAERQKLPAYFAADRAEHLYGLPDNNGIDGSGICAKTRAGIICISERYLFSSLVYQAQSYGPHELAKIWELNCKFPLPQHLIYLEIEAEAAEQRIAQREAEQQSQREIFETADFLMRVRQSYFAVTGRFRQLVPAMQIHQLNARQTREALHRQILQCLGL